MRNFDESATYTRAELLQLGREFLFKLGEKGIGKCRSGYVACRTGNGQ